MVYYNSQFKKVKEIKSAIYNINNREVELLYKPEGAYIILTVEEVFKLAELLKKNKDDEEKTCNVCKIRIDCEEDKCVDCE